MEESGIDAIWFACRSKACAPPPVGTGGSLDVAGSEMPAATKRKLTAAKKSKKSSGAKTATGSRKKTTKAVSAKLQSRIDAIRELQAADKEIRKRGDITPAAAKRYYDAANAVGDNVGIAATPEAAAKRMARANKAYDWSRGKMRRAGARRDTAYQGGSPVR